MSSNRGKYRAGEIVTTVVTMLLAASPILAEDTVGLTAPGADAANAFKPQKHFSPYAGRNFPTNVYFGDTHLHTGMSMDAGAFGARLGPEDAYRFARGEEVTSSTGLQAKLSRPLDFLVVADHSDNMGFFPQLFAGDPKMLADPTGKRWYSMVQEGGQQGVAAAVEVIEAFSQNRFPEALAFLPGSEAYRSAWEETIDAAEKYNDPGRFTAFIGYEWTSNANGNNLHRVVVYRGDGDEARRRRGGLRSRDPGPGGKRQDQARGQGLRPDRGQPGRRDRGWLRVRHQSRDPALVGR